MRLSVVTTLYRSELFLGEFLERMTTALGGVTDDYEIILVNDGSPDNVLAAALALQAKDERVKIVDLSRNFGHHPAMMIGLRYSRGDWVFLIDCDLEEDPAVAAEFFRVQADTRADVVFGVQEVRRGGWFERASGWLYYGVVNALAKEPLPRNLLTVRLMSRRYVDALLQHGEVELNIACLWVHTGFLQVPVVIHKAHKGSSTYNLFRKLALLVNAITSMSNPAAGVHLLPRHVHQRPGRAGGPRVGH